MAQARTDRASGAARLAGLSGSPFVDEALFRDLRVPKGGFVRIAKSSQQAVATARASADLPRVFHSSLPSRPSTDEPAPLVADFPTTISTQWN